MNKSNIGEEYYQPDLYDDGFDSWQNTQTPEVNGNSMMNGQSERPFNSYERRGY